MTLFDDYDFGDKVDKNAFEQILDMDEGDDEEMAHEFSKSIVFGFFEQAEQTFEKLDTALKNQDLEELSVLGHFLKGSSATLGFTKVKDECEKIQNYGRRQDEAGVEVDKHTCLAKITTSVTEVKREYRLVKDMMIEFYGKLEGD